MAARDANNATWYILRYASDFTPRVATAGDPAPPQFVPPDAPALVYDASRHVLELMPAKPPQEAAPPPGLAVGVDGEVYRVDPADCRLLVRRCDGTEALLLCEPGIVRAPSGLALDRRGFLYVADPGARRVIVLLPDDASSVAIFREGLIEPVDVAVAPGGQIYIADRAAGRIVQYSAGFAHVGDFLAQGAGGLPAPPRPIAVMVDADGSLLVADGNYPWLLRFSPTGVPLGDVSLPALVAPLRAQNISIDDLASLLAGTAARLVARLYPPTLPARSGTSSLSTPHCRQAVESPWRQLPPIPPLPWPAQICPGHPRKAAEPRSPSPPNFPTNSCSPRRAATCACGSPLVPTGRRRPASDF
jgi:hypothetical protein